MGADRGGDVGHRHPPGEELHLDARLAPVHPHGRRGGPQLRDLLPRPTRSGSTSQQSGSAFLQMLAAATILQPDRDRAGVAAVGPDRAQARDLRLHGARRAWPRDHRPRTGRQRRDARRGHLRRLAGHVPRRRLGADDRHHPEGRFGAVHGPLERRHGVVDHDRGGDRWGDDRPRSTGRSASASGIASSWSSGWSTSCSARWRSARSSSPIAAVSRGRRGRDYTWSPRNSLTRRSTAPGDATTRAATTTGAASGTDPAWR